MVDRLMVYTQSLGEENTVCHPRPGIALQNTEENQGLWEAGFVVSHGWDDHVIGLFE